MKYVYLFILALVMVVSIVDMIVYYDADVEIKIIEESMK